MSNQTHVTYFILTGFLNMSQLRYLIFVILSCLYVAVLCSNLLVIAAIGLNRSLHDPMYLFLCSVCVNEIFGSTAILPFLLVHVLRDVHTVPHSLCFLQIFCLYTYATSEFFTLAIISYDRYLAVCLPLQYHARMNTRKVLILVVVSWSGSVIVNVIPICLSAPLMLCGNVIPKVYCVNYYIVRMACYDVIVNNIYGVVASLFTVFTPLIFFVVVYVRILVACFRSSPQTKQKALSTCLPHLISMVNFSFGALFEVIQSRFDLRFVHSVVPLLLSLYWIVSAPILNPLIYGLILSKVRKSLKVLFLKASPSA